MYWTMSRALLSRDLTKCLLLAIGARVLEAGSRYHRWYHMSMDKTTVYLPLELKTALRRLARERGVSEAEVIRESIRHAVTAERPSPRPGLFAGGTSIAREADEHLRGFGDR
jgi:hypothetical protein